MAKAEQGAEQQSLPLLDHLARVGRRAAETSMSPGGLRPRHLIALKLLSEHGAASQQGLAEALSLDPSNVVGLLNELEERGLITRRRDPADRRRHIVELSAGGPDGLCLGPARLRRGGGAAPPPPPPRRPPPPYRRAVGGRSGRAVPGPGPAEPGRGRPARRAEPGRAGDAVPAARPGGRRRRREGGGLHGGRPPWLRRLAGARPACCRGTPRPP